MTYWRHSLGILFPQQTGKIIEKILDPLLKKISLDTERWSPLFLSIWGKVNVLKMNCIPRLTYVLQCLPIAIPHMYFKRFDHICKKFLWNGKRPRIKLEKLQLPTSKGDMGLPTLGVVSLCLLPETYSSVDTATWKGPSLVWYWMEIVLLTCPDKCFV